MQIVEFTDASLRFVDAVPDQPPRDGFVWIFLEQPEFETAQAQIQQAALKLGGSALLDLHCKDLASPLHPSHYDSTSIYDLIIFRRLATQHESAQEKAISNYPGQGGMAKKRGERLPTFNRIASKAVGFAVFDRCLISVHPPGCYAAKSFIQRFLADAKFSLDASGADPASARNRLPISPADLALRMIADHPDISGLFVVWDTPAYAVATLLQTEGHALAMATVDLGEDVAIALAAGRHFVSVAAQQPFQQGVAAARTTILALLGRTVPAWIAMPGVAVARGNVADSFQIIWRKPAPREVLRLLGLAP